MRKVLLSLSMLAPLSAHARDVKPLVIVVPVEGAAVARDVAKELYDLGHTVERGGSPAAPNAGVPPPLDAAKQCVGEGHSLAFRLEFATAIRRLADCEERLGGALARPEGTAALSSILVELAAAALAAGEKDRARTTFAKLAMLANATPPDPVVHPPEVIALWEQVKSEPPPARQVTIETQPRWTRVWIDGRLATPRMALSAGSHFATAEAAGHAPFAGFVVVDDSARLSVRLPPLESEARYRALMNASGWIFGPDDAEAPATLTDAFNAPVLMVNGGPGRAPSAVLFLPAKPGEPARVGGRWTAVGEGAPRTLAKNASRALGVKEPQNRRTLVYVGGAVAAVLAAGAVATLAQPRTKTGDKTGTVVFE